MQNTKLLCTSNESGINFDQKFMCLCSAEIFCYLNANTQENIFPDSPFPFKVLNLWHCSIAEICVYKRKSYIQELYIHEFCSDTIYILANYTQKPICLYIWYSLHSSTLRAAVYSKAGKGIPEDMLKSNSLLDQVLQKVMLTLLI